MNWLGFARIFCLSGRKGAANRPIFVDAPAPKGGGKMPFGAK
jgi:hypothetical protein